MRVHQKAVYCLLVMAVLAAALSGCSSTGTVRTDAAGQPLAAVEPLQDAASGRPILKSVTLVDQANGCSLSFLTGLPPQYTVFKLSDPYRIIVDLPGFSIAEQADLSVAVNDYITGVTSEKMQDKDRDYLRLIVGLRDDFAYNTASDNSTLHIHLGQKATAAATAVAPSKSAGAGQVRSAVNSSTGRNVISAIVPHSGVDGISIEIASDAPIGKYHAYALKNPQRLVIDIPGAQAKLSSPKIAVNNEFIQQIRIGNDPRNLRVVFDMASAELPQYQIAKQNNSLLVHLQSDKNAAVELVNMHDDSAQEPDAEPEIQERQAAAPAEESSGADLPESAPQRMGGPNISFDFKDADIKNVLRLIADISGRNMIISDSVSGRVTLKLDNIPIDEALNLILETNGLDSIVTRNITRIETRERIKTINEEKLLARKSHEEAVELEIKTFDVSYSKAQDIAGYIKQLKVLSERGNVTSFKLTNKVTVKDIPENIPKIAALIREQDVPTRQVMIEARVVQSNPGYTKELGIQWGGTYKASHNGDPIVIGGGAGSGNVVNLPAPAGVGSGGAINLGYISDTLTLNMQLSALENDDKIKIVSNPRVIGLDNQEARIKQGVALPYLTLNDNGVTSTEFKDAVLELQVTPKITPSNTVALDIKVTKNQKSAQTGAGGEPGIDIREVETFLLVKSGVTAVIGGIYETQQTVNIKRVPFFGTLPYLGYFFKNVREDETLTELLIFLTVTVLEQPEELAQGHDAAAS